MRTSTYLLAVSFIITVAISGCKQEKPASPEGPASVTAARSGGVAILDLDKVAKRFGCDKQMSTSLTQREASLNKQLAAIKESYEKQIAEKRQEFGPTPTAEQEKLLADIQRQAVASLNKVRKQAKNNLSRHGSLLIQGFRTEIKPIAREIAQQKGLSIIVTKNDSVVFDYDTTVDITDGVIEKLLVLQAEHSQNEAAGEQTASDPAETAARPTRPVR